VHALPEIVGLLQALLSDPGGSLHELGSLHVTGLGNCFDSSQPLLEQLILLGKQAALPLGFVVSEHVLGLVSFVIVFGFVERADSVVPLYPFTDEALLEALLQLHDFNVVFVLDASDFLQMRVFQNVVGLGEEVVDQQHAVLPTWSHLEKPAPVLFHKREDLRRDRLVRNVDLIPSLGLTHIS